MDNHAPRTLPHRGLIALLLFMALLLCGGGAMELLTTALMPWFPPEVQQALDNLHADLLVQRWVIFSNAFHVLAGAGYLAGAVGLLRERAWGARLARLISWAMICSTLTGQAILAARLYPTLASDDPAMMATMLASALLVGAAAATALFLTRKSR